MSNLSFTGAQPLLWEAVPYSGRCGGKTRAFLFLLIGLGIVLFFSPVHLLAEQEPAVTLLQRVLASPVSVAATGTWPLRSWASSWCASRQTVGGQAGTTSNVYLGAPSWLAQRWCAIGAQRGATPALTVSPASQLAQLAGMTTLSIDTGDLDIIKKFASTGLITDATTNPLFVSQAGLSGDARYIAFVDSAIAYAREHADNADAVLELAMDRLAVELGLEITKIVPGYVSTEVDIRESFNTAESLRRARRIIAMYEAAGVPRSRVLIKLAGTWEGIQAARELEKEGINTNITLIFGFIQAVAAAQAGVRLISPFPGRIKDWFAANGGEEVYEPSMDPGVVCVTKMYEYYKKHGHEGTICMPASWRPSRGKSDPAYATDEIVALAGVDRMTIPPPLLEQLANTESSLARVLEPSAATAACKDELVGEGDISESQFRLAFNEDVCATTKMAEGINAFVGETLKLEAAIKSKLQ